MIRREIAEFRDNLLKFFDGPRAIRKKDLEIKYKDDTYLLVQTEKHLKILETDGLIRNNGFAEYHLQPKGLRVLNNIESLGYLARHRWLQLKLKRRRKRQKKETTMLFI